jgi:hypothetical protein
MGESIEIRNYKSEAKAEWDNFIDSSKNGSFHLKRNFVEYHQDRFIDHSLMIYDNNELKAIIPANIREGNVYAHQGLTYGGIIVKQDIYLTEYITIIHALFSHLKKTGISLFTIKEIPWTYCNGFNDDFRFAMDLLGATIRSFDVLPHVDIKSPLEYQNRRTRSIKKAINQQFIVKESTDLEAYWQMLESLLKKYGAKPVHSLEEMIILQNDFPKNIRLFEVRENNELIAGTLIFETKLVSRAQYIASSERGKQTGALDLIFHELISNVYKNKRYFEFGTTTLYGGLKLNFGLSDQKEGFGARSVVQQTYELNIGSIDIAKLEQLKL